jgi:hypothetical protein
MMRNHLLQTRDHGLKPHCHSLSILVSADSMTITVDDRVSYLDQERISNSLVSGVSKGRLR